jgi:hypothetical protein
MSQELIYDVLYSALELADSILQIWITLTFAVIVSTYVAGTLGTLWFVHSTWKSVQAASRSEANGS